MLSRASRRKGYIRKHGADRALRAWHQIEEWMLTHEPKKILEIGTHRGVTTLRMADLSERWDGWVDTVEVSAEKVASTKKALLGYLGVTNVTFHVADSLSLLLSPWLTGRRWNFILIDGNHGGGYAERELDLLIPTVSPGGVIVLDDADWCRDVQKAAKVYGYEIRGSLAWGRAAP